MENQTKTKITIRNTFHNSQVGLILTNGKINHSQSLRARRALCGRKGCRCEGMLVEVVRNSDGISFVRGIALCDLEQF